LQRLVEWLDEVLAEQEETADFAANQGVLAYLQSYKDTFSRSSFLQVRFLPLASDPGIKLIVLDKSQRRTLLFQKQ
jgi:hypothetical protein